MMLRASFRGDPNIGLYGFATESCVFLGMRTRLDSKIEESLGKIRSSGMLQTGFAGIFCAGNSSGIIVPRILADYELEGLRKTFSDILVLDTDYSAIGNLVLLNDSGIILSPLLRRHRRAVKEFFRLPCEISKVANTSIAGSMAIATNKGCLAGPGTKKHEIKILEDVLNVELGLGTVSFGSPFVRSGIIANSKGFVVSETSSGPEIGRISESLGFF